MSVRYIEGTFTGSSQRSASFKVSDPTRPINIFIESETGNGTVELHRRFLKNDGTFTAWNVVSKNVDGGAASWQPAGDGTGGFNGTVFERELQDEDAGENRGGPELSLFCTAHTANIEYRLSQ